MVLEMKNALTTPQYPSPDSFRNDIDIRQETVYLRFNRQDMTHIEVLVTDEGHNEW